MSDAEEISENAEAPFDMDSRHFESFTKEDPSSFAHQIASGMV